MFSDGIFEIIKQEETQIDFKERIKKLPYIFKDPIKFDKKVDPKKLLFGSKIDNNHSERETYYTVKEIISPAVLVLNTGLKVRLLGVKERAESNREATQFLREKTRGQKVFLRFDNIKYDDENNLLCYLYLWNKTFLNAHLIKNGLVDVNTTFDYKYKSKFLSKRGTL
jgi:site-specific DNA-methyltransferase (adenine-specific)